MSEKEIELLENVELRMALAATSEQFEKCLNTFLCPVLLKLDSPHEVVRQKVMSMCSHVSKRLKANVNMKLPIKNLIELFVSTKSNFISNFTLLYLEMAFNRATEEEKIELVPKLVQNISSRLTPQKIQIFQIFLKILDSFNNRRVDYSKETNPDIFNFKANENDLQFLLEKFADVLLYIPSMPSKESSSSDISPGLSLNAKNFVTNNGKSTLFDGADLSKIKKSVVQFTMSDIIPNDVRPFHRFVVFVIASTDSNYEIANLGDSALKKIKNPNFEDKNVITELYKLYQGSQLIKGKESDCRKCVSNNLKLKLMNYFEKSECAVNMFPNFIQVCFDCLYGNDTNLKLRRSGMIFTQWIARMTKPENIRIAGPVLLTGLMKYIEEHKFETGVEPEGLLCYAYEATGLLSTRLPELFIKDISIIEKLFNLLSKESSNVRSSVQNALSSICESLKNSEKSEQFNKEIENILLDNISKDEHHTRYCVIKYCTTLFPFSHSLSRYMCIVGTGDTKIEVRELSQIGLLFSNNMKCLPSLKEFLNIINIYVFSQKNNNTQNTGSMYINNLPIDSYCNMLEFIRQLIIVIADPEVQIDELGKVTEETIMTQTTQRKVKEYLKSFWNEGTNQYKDGKNPIDIYISLIEMLLNSNSGNSNLQAVASSCLLELICFGPCELLANYSNKINWIEPFIYSVKVETRKSMGHILGIISTENSDNNNTIVIELLIKLLNILESPNDQKKSTIEFQHGSLITIGYIIGKLQLRYPKKFRSILKCESLPNLYEKLVEKVISYLNASSNILISGACISLSEICRYSVNPLVIEESNATTATNDENAIKVQKRLIEIINETKDSKIQEISIMTLAHLALGTPSVVNEIMESYYTIAEKMSKNVELLFTLGEAISIIVGGWNSNIMDKYLDIADVLFPIEGHSMPQNEIIKSFLSKCLDEMLKSGRPNKCKIVCIWLLCLVKYTSKLQYIQDNLSDIHSAFSLLLADRDEFTQEVASKGIGLVYDLGNENVKQNLVGSLVNTLSEGRKMGKVTESTRIFNNLGSTPDGSQLSTYKDLLGLAADMNQPDLVYKFMNLASHNAIWNSRRGASLGVSVIMSQAKTDLLPFLPTLIPRLYRFQFDPNVKVNEAMKSVWKSLVKDPKKMIDTYFDQIIVELINGLGDKMWRTRESSCLALADLLHGRKMNQLEKYLEDLWNMTFRTLDDVKESVRIAAFSSCKVLTNITVSNCDPTVVSLEDGQKAIKTVIPFLIKQGLPSPAEEVKHFSLNTIFKLCKTAGVLLKPHIASIVSILLESLSSLEPQAINYISFHVESTQNLDNMRLSATKTSPIMESIENCINNIDEDVMKELAPELNNLIRRGVGFPTKAGTARYVVSLTLRIPNIVRPYADTILKSLSTTMTDRNITIRKLYSSSIGYISHIVTPNALSKLIQKISNQYIESDEEENRMISAVVLKEMSQHASDQIKNNCLKIVLPIALFGSFDSDETIKNIWKEVWDDNTAGSSGAIKLYMKEIIELLLNHLVSNSWRVKKQAACTLIGIVKITDSFIESSLDTIMPTLINGVYGRIWDGKESMIEALAVTVIACKDSPLLNDESKWGEEIIKIMLRESKKNNKKYKRQAIYWMGEIFSKLNIEKFEEVCEILIPLVGGWPNDEEKDDMMDEDDDDPNEKPLTLLVTAASYKCIGKCFSTKKVIQEKYSKNLTELFSLGLENNVWSVRLAILDAILDFFEKFDFSSNNIPINSSDLIKLSKGMFKCLEDGKYTVVREKTLVVIKKIINLIKDNDILFNNELKRYLNENLKKYEENEKMTSLKENTKEIIKMLK